MTTTEIAAELIRLRARKDELEAATKENNKAIEEIKKKLADAMVDDDLPDFSHGGFTFKLADKTSYTKKSEEAIAEAGVTYFDVLREAGLGDIIVETVNARTLQSTIAAFVEENGGLTEDLQKVIREYEYTDVTVRKAAQKKKSF